MRQGELDNQSIRIIAKRGVKVTVEVVVRSVSNDEAKSTDVHL